MGRNHMLSPNHKAFAQFLYLFCAALSCTSYTSLRNTHPSSLLTSTATDKFAKCYCPCEKKGAVICESNVCSYSSTSNHSCQHCWGCWRDHLWDTQELKSRSIKNRNISLLTFTDRILTDPKAFAERYFPQILLEGSEGCHVSTHAKGIN